MSWSVEHDGEGQIRVHIEGYLDDAEGQQAVDAVVAQLGSQPRDIIFEVDATAGVRRSVRIAWQAALLPLRGQIRRFVVHGGGAVMRMSVNVMAMFLGVPVEGVAAEPDAPVRRERAASASQARTRPLSRAVLDTPKRESSWAGQLLRRTHEASRSDF